jgi:ketosteroid isomerase-like protein
MSQENAEVVRRVFVEVPVDGADVAPLVRDDATWTRRRAELEAIFEPDCAVAWIAQGERLIEATGLDDSRQGWLDWLEPWETYHAQVERIIPAGDKVLVLVRLHGRMAGTQNEVEMISASVYLLREGKVARVEHYANRAEALVAVGLRE